MSYTGVESLKEFLNNKNVFFWGMGSLAEAVVKKFLEMDVRNYKFIDSDISKRGSIYLNGEVYTPDYVENYNKENFIIISCRYYSEIEPKLQKIGYKKYINYIDGINLENTLLELYYRDKGILFASPLTIEQLDTIRNQMVADGLNILDAHISGDEFDKFEQELDFGKFYKKKVNKTYERKIREYWFASNLLDLNHYGEDDIYLDVGASTSPWVLYLRERKGIKAFGIDMMEYPNNNKEYYLVQNATQMDFESGTISGISLQSAFCLFEENGDVKFLKECSRILKTGGKLVVSPLYMYSEYISAASAINYGKGFADAEQTEMIRTDSPYIRMSRYYDVKTLNSRILKYCEELGMKYTIHILPNDEVLEFEFAYLKFVLEIEKL